MNAEAGRNHWLELDRLTVISAQKGPSQTNLAACKVAKAPKARSWSVGDHSTVRSREQEAETQTSLASILFIQMLCPGKRAAMSQSLSVRLPHRVVVRRKQ